MSTLDAEAVYIDFKIAIEELRINSKPYINMLTMLAEEFQNHAQSVVRALEERILQAPTDMKIPVLYVMDSIIKNLKETDYLSLFSLNIVKIFVQVFEKLDDKNRQALHKLRMTWTDVFSNGKLYAIDMAVNQIDNGWPVVASPEMSIHVNPNFVKPNENQLSTDSNLTRDPRLAKLRDNSNNITSLKNKTISFLCSTANESNDDRKRRKSSDSNTFNKTFTHDQDYRLSNKITCFGRTSTNNSVANFNLSNDDKNFGLKRLNQTCRKNPVSNCLCSLEIDGRVYDMLPNVIQPCQVNGIRIELLCDTRERIVFANFQPVARFLEPKKSVNLPGLLNKQVSIQYLGQCIDIWIDCQRFQVRLDGPPTLIQLYNRPYSISLDGGTKEFCVNNSKRAIYTEFAPFTISLNDQEKIQNFTHEVTFFSPTRTITVNEICYTMRYDMPISCAQAPDGNFYSIRFQGNAREIFIDSIAHVVPFDRPTRVKFDKMAHEVAWGGPGFEVIVDGSPYELAFNHPGRDIPFGDRMHHVRIQGSLPSVKIMDRLPFNESMSINNLPIEQEYMPLSREIKNENNFVQNDSDRNVEVISLYDKLLHHGIIPKENKPNNEVDKDPIVTTTVSTPSVYEDDPLETINIDQLRKFGNNNFDQLYEGIQCPQCGLRFNDQTKSKYQIHLDWHFRLNKKERDVALDGFNGHNLHRDWYYELDVWLKIEEIRDEQDIDTPEDINEMGDEIKNKRLIHRSCPASSDDRENVCRLCYEPFDLFFHNEREEWHLQGAVRVGDWVYHSTCLQDASDPNEEFDNITMITAELIEGMLATLVNKSVW